MPSNAADKDQARRNYLQAIKHDYPRNASIIVLFEFLWGLGLPFAMFATTVPAYMTAINSPKILIGFIVSLPIILCPMQIITSHYFAGRAKKVWLSFTYLACIIPWLLHNLLLFFYPNTFGRSAKLAMFIFCMLVFWLSIIANDVVRFSMITDCTPLKKRGSLFGIRAVALASGLLLMWKLADWIFSRWSEPRNFLAAFAVGNLFYMIASLTYLHVREHRNPVIKNSPTPTLKISYLVRQTLLVLKQLLRNQNYRVFIFFMTLFTVSVMTGSFIVVFAREKLQVTGSQILTLTIILSTTAAFFCFVFGKLADRIGYRIIGILQGVLLALGYLFVAIGSIADFNSNAVIYLGFFFFATVYFTFRMVMRNFSIELVGHLDVAILVSLGQLIMMPVILLTAPLAGLIIDLTDTYLAVFLLGLTFALTSSVGFAFLVREPRTRKMYVVKSLTQT